MLGRKRRTGTKQTKKITILNDVSSLFVLSQCVSCVPTWWFLHHVTVGCKGPINSETDGAPLLAHNELSRFLVRNQGPIFPLKYVSLLFLYLTRYVIIIGNSIDTDTISSALVF